MRITPLLMLSLIFFLCNTGCKKLADASHINLDTITTTNISYAKADVYVAGTVTVPAGGGFTYEAAYWKDGALTILSNESTSSATGIAVLGNDVYVTGTIPGDGFGITRACVWKNGVLQLLSPDSGYSDAKCIALKGSDVIVAGDIFDKTGAQAGLVYLGVPVYWDNGVPVKIPGASFINSMAVSGQDIYFAGARVQTFTYSGKDTLGGGNIAAYWKNNGPAVDLVQPIGSYAVSGVNGIAVSGQNVYAAGFGLNVNVSAFWQNGSMTTLSQSNYNGNAASIAVDGNDVYIGGNLIVAGYPQAYYWKNNVATMLPTGDITYTFSQVIAIAVSGSDVYSAGALYQKTTGFSTAALWQNEAIVKLTDGGNLGASANAIFIVPK